MSPQQATLSIRFAVGQVWSDGKTTPQTVVAITEHPERPIITQDEDGEVYSYTRMGRFHSGNGAYDLVTLITDTKAGDDHAVV